MYMLLNIRYRVFVDNTWILFSAYLALNTHRMKIIIDCQINIALRPFTTKFNTSKLLLPVAINNMHPRFMMTVMYRFYDYILGNAIAITHA